MKIAKHYSQQKNLLIYSFHLCHTIIHIVMSTQQDSKGLPSGKHPCIREHLLKNNSLFCLKWNILGTVIHYTILKINRTVQNVLPPKRKWQQLRLSLALVPKQLIKKQFLKSAYIQWNSSHYLPQQVQLLAQHGCFRYKYLQDNETVQQMKSQPS